MTSHPDRSAIAMFGLTGRRALVTGARRGIGRAIALAFAAQGAHVAIHHAGTKEEQRDAESVLTEIHERNGTAQLLAANFEPAGAGARLAAAVTAAFGHVDILVLNASIELLEEYEAIPTESFDRQIAVNLRAPLELVQTLLPGMKQRGWRRLLAIGSAAARKAGMTQEMWGEVRAIIGMANETNKLAFGLQVPIDPMFQDP